MIVKVFQKNKNGKIEFTKEELETLLNEIYQDGYRANSTSTWTWTTPLSYPTYTPTYTTVTGLTNTTTAAITIGDKK